MRISIAMATYNGERFLAEQLDSFASQTLLPVELVVCDDGSTDATLRIVDEFARRAPFIVRIFRNETNLGWRDNFLKAARLCEGDWIAFADQDDVWLSRKLENVRRVFQRHPGVRLVIHSAAIVRDDLSPVGSRIPDFKRFQVVDTLKNAPWKGIWGFACCFDRNLLDGVPFSRRPRDHADSNYAQAHDELIFLLANVMGRIAYIPTTLTLYRRHSNTVTATYISRSELMPSVAGMSSDALKRLSGITREYSTFMLEVKKSQTGTKARRCQKAAAYFEKLAVLLLTRAELYREDISFGSRIQIFFRLLRSGAYREFGCGMSYKAIIKDAAISTMGTVIRRMSRIQLGGAA